MGTQNYSLAKTRDIFNNGGIFSSFRKLDEKDYYKLLKPYEVDSTDALFGNTTLKKTYDDNQLVRYNDINIADAYAIGLGVELPPSYKFFKINGGSYNMEYPNGAKRLGLFLNMDWQSATTIPLTWCCDGTIVSVGSGLLDWDMTVQLSTANPNDFIDIGDNVIKPMIVEGKISVRPDYSITCTGPMTYPCFVVTVDDNPLPPSTGDTGTTVTTRKIDIYIDTSNVGLYKLFIDTASFGTGHTLSEVQDSLNLKQALIPELSKEITGLTMSPTAVQATIEVPSDAYVVIRLSDPKGSPSNLINLSLYDWEQDNYQYVSPGKTRASVTYTVTSYKID